MAEQPKYPHVSVRLTETDGNAFSVIGTVRQALRRSEGIDVAEAFVREAMAGDYDHVLRTCMAWVEVD